MFQWKSVQCDCLDINLIMSHQFHIPGRQSAKFIILTDSKHGAASFSNGFMRKSVAESQSAVVLRTLSKLREFVPNTPPLRTVALWLFQSVIPSSFDWQNCLICQHAFPHFGRSFPLLVLLSSSIQSLPRSLSASQPLPGLQFTSGTVDVRSQPLISTVHSPGPTRLPNSNYFFWFWKYQIFVPGQNMHTRLQIMICDAWQWHERYKVVWRSTTALMFIHASQKLPPARSSPKRPIQCHWTERLCTTYFWTRDQIVLASCMPWLDICSTESVWGSVARFGLSEFLAQTRTRLLDLWVDGGVRSGFVAMEHRLTEAKMSGYLFQPMTLKWSLNSLRQVEMVDLPESRSNVVERVFLLEAIRGIISNAVSWPDASSRAFQRDWELWSET